MLFLGPFEVYLLDEYEMKKNLTCVRCESPAFPPAVKKTFLCFPKFLCMRCGLTNVYPPSTTMVVIYWILAFIFLLIFGLGLANGHVMTPGVIFIAGFWGIFANAKIRRYHRLWSASRANSAAQDPK
jgi:hypothetical protein